MEVPGEAVESAVGAAEAEGDAAADAEGDAAAEARSDKGTGRRVHPATRSAATRIAGTVRTRAAYSTRLDADGHTCGMKTAVSVPDDVFERAERLARREKRSRSDVYSAALREYVARHLPDEVAEALDRVVGDVGEGIDPFVTDATRRTLESTEW